MRIYTKTGDDGTTSLIGGTRVPKNSVRLEAYGTVDELNSAVGMLRSFSKDSRTTAELEEIQSVLFDVGGILATDTLATGGEHMGMDVTDKDITALEQAIDRMDAELPPLRSFILPGGSQAVASCHIARTVCRRAERRILDMAGECPPDNAIIKYINRLSDYLFVLSRKMAHDGGVDELKWKPRN